MYISSSFSRLRLRQACSNASFLLYSASSMKLLRSFLICSACCTTGLLSSSSFWGISASSLACFSLRAVYRYVSFERCSFCSEIACTISSMGCTCYSQCDCSQAKALDSYFAYCLLPSMARHYNYNRKRMLSDKELRSLVRIGTGSAASSSEYEEEEEQSVLDLSHKDLKRTRQIDLTKLQVSKVDASYNFFKDLNALKLVKSEEHDEQQQVQLEWLDMSFNYIEKIDQSPQASDLLAQLKYLNLAANRIQTVDFSSMEIPSLQFLDLSSNKLHFFMHSPPLLKVLLLNDNHLTSLAFTHGDNITILSARNNRISKIALETPKLALVDLESNQVTELEAVRGMLEVSPGLLSINMRDNEVSGMMKYRTAALELCPQIGEIDDVPINPQVREGFRVLKAESKINEMLDEVNQRYQEKLVQKQKIKDELIKKIRKQEEDVQLQFNKQLAEEKEHFGLVETEAKRILGRKKMGAEKEKDQLMGRMGDYTKEEGGDQEQEQKQNALYEVRKQHVEDYLDYIKSRKGTGQKVRMPPRLPVKAEKPLRQSILAPTQSLEWGEEEDKVKGIQLFDPDCVDSLMESYLVEQLEM